MSPKRVLIVGGVAGGASCAARLRRLDEQAEIVVFEKGPYPSFANCGLPYYIAPSRTGLDLHCIEAPQRSPVLVHVVSQRAQVLRLRRAG
jgi:NADPH-dependent 2,4-dienoyl-CoA reductase/sulfur reductase-like enzyme